jgi:hypothetical protein
MLQKYLAAARDDQFLVEQDLHEAAALMGGVLPNSDHRIPELPVTIDHRIAIRVPEPVSIAVDMGHGYRPSPCTRSPDLRGAAS